MLQLGEGSLKEHKQNSMKKMFVQIKKKLLKVGFDKLFIWKQMHGFSMQACNWTCVFLLTIVIL